MLRLMKPKRRTVLIPAQICEMARPEILEAIGADTLDQIKRHDPHPQLVAMSVGHEGVSTGPVLGHGRVEKIWSDNSIMQLARNVSGAEVYINHTADNVRREPHGRVIQGVVKRIGNRLHAIAIAHITNAFTRRKISEGALDACSIEADCLFAPAADRHWIVKAVERVTGVALASAAVFKTGFRHAGVLAAVQEFEESTEPTLDDVREAIQTLKLTPDKVFAPEEILSTPFVKDAIDNETDARKQDTTDEVKRLQENLATMEREVAPVRERKARTAWARLIEQSPHLKDTERALVRYLADTLTPPSGGAVDQATADRMIAQELERIRQYNITFNGSDRDGENDVPVPADTAHAADYADPQYNDLIPSL